MIKSTPILIILLMISSLGLTLCPPKQVWAISQGESDIIIRGMEIFGPMLGDLLSPKDESEGTGNPPNMEPPAPLLSNDPCADPGANPGLEGLCGGSQLGTLPHGSSAPPYDPLLVMQQYWENFEFQLSYFAPQDQAAILSEFRLMIELGLAPYPPEQQQEAIQMLKQTMSPELSEELLPT